MTRNSGQITIEAVLVLAILFSTIYAATRVIRDEQYLAKLVERPWSHLSGIIETGNWGPPEANLGLHPNHIERHGSPRADDI